MRKFFLTSIIFALMFGAVTTLTPSPAFANSARDCYEVQSLNVRTLNDCLSRNGYDPITPREFDRRFGRQWDEPRYDRQYDRRDRRHRDRYYDEPYYGYGEYRPRYRHGNELEDVLLNLVPFVIQEVTRPRCEVTRYLDQYGNVEQEEIVCH